MRLFSRQKQKIYQALPLTRSGEKLTAVTQTGLKSRDEQDVDNPENSIELQTAAKTLHKAIARGEEKSCIQCGPLRTNSRDENSM